MTQRLRRLKDAIASARRFSFEDWRFVVLGQIALLRALHDLRTRPKGELVQRSEGQPTSTATPTRLDDARKIAQGVVRASSHGLVRGTCLVRSMAICRRLDDEGIEGGVLRIGVAQRNGKFQAHAWVEFGTAVIGDDAEGIQQYGTLDGIMVARPQ